MTRFYAIGGFPGVTGCIDCTYIPIKSPGVDDTEETEEERAARLEKRRKYEASRRVHSDKDGSSSSSVSHTRAADQQRNETPS